MLRTLLSRRWLGALALAVAVAVGCVLLGTWQWHRREQQLAANAAVTGNYDLPPAPLSASPAAAGGRLPAAAEWTPVRLQGRYLPERTALLRNRTLAGRPGYHVLVPFRDADGTVLVVDRGFVPTGRDGGTPDTVPPPPDGQVQVVARLRPPEPGTDRSAPAGQVRRIVPEQVTGSPAPASLLTGAYGVLAAERPAPGSSPVPLPRPEVDEGPHLSYALQWFVFALGALAAWALLLRRAVRERAGVVAPPPRRRRGPTAEEEEDAAVEAAARRNRAPT